MSSAPRIKIPDRLRRGNRKTDERESVDSGRDLIAYMTKVLGKETLADSRILDVGCGTKFTQAFIDYDIPVGEYVGLDVYRDMIEYLDRAVTDDRFSYRHMDIHNAMYNPQGQKLTTQTQLPLQKSHFDIISLFSVFTHIEPEDYHNMLCVLRPHIKASGKIIFSVFIEELTGNGYGLYEQLAADSRDTWQPSGLDFHDASPDKPLRWAIYSKEHALRLIDDTGWKIEKLHLPNELVQHHFVCTPI